MHPPDAVTRPPARAALPDTMGADRCSVAPMVDVTTPVFRRIMRLFTRRCMLYTPMIAAEAVQRHPERLFDDAERELPCTLQVGGSNPRLLQAAARTGERLGFSAVNLNAGCPSERVRSGDFGAVLMRSPRRLAALYAAMQEGTSVEVSVKTRIGVDELDSLEYACELVDALQQAGCRHVILHARRALLGGLSPRQNRQVPPLDYARVYAVRERFPGLRITINGGIGSLDGVRAQLQRVDGVMIGRAVIDNPYMMAAADQELFGDPRPVAGRGELLAACCDLYESRFRGRVPFHHFAHCLLGLFHGCPGARSWRHSLSCCMTRPGADARVLTQAWQAMQAGRQGPWPEAAEADAGAGGTCSPAARALPMEA